MSTVFLHALSECPKTLSRFKKPETVQLPFLRNSAARREICTTHKAAIRPHHWGASMRIRGAPASALHPVTPYPVTGAPARNVRHVAALSRLDTHPQAAATSKQRALHGMMPARSSTPGVPSASHRHDLGPHASWQPIISSASIGASRMSRIHPFPAHRLQELIASPTKMVNKGQPPTMLHTSYLIGPRPAVLPALTPPSSRVAVGGAALAHEPTQRPPQKKHLDTAQRGKGPQDPHRVLLTGPDRISATRMPMPASKSYGDCYARTLQGVQQRSDAGRARSADHSMTRPPASYEGGRSGQLRVSRSAAMLNGTPRILRGKHVAANLTSVTFTSTERSVAARVSACDDDDDGSACTTREPGGWGDELVRRGRRVSFSDTADDGTPHPSRPSSSRASSVLPLRSPLGRLPKPF